MKIPDVVAINSCVRAESSKGLPSYLFDNNYHPQVPLKSRNAAVFYDSSLKTIQYSVPSTNIVCGFTIFVTRYYLYYTC